ncbi:unnamed protein product [Prorocentrum cordatum]|nr:unnamed protein product [Polarella glacialis]
MFDVGSRSCGCIGVDYAGQTCAAAFLCGTMVEVRVTEGAFDDAELVELVCSLRPVASAARAEQLFRQPFAERCYWARHPHAGGHVTFLGVSSLFEGFLWNFGLGPRAPARWRCGSSSARLPGECVSPVDLAGYALDSVGVIDGAAIPWKYSPFISRRHRLGIITSGSGTFAAWGQAGRRSPGRPGRAPSPARLPPRRLEDKPSITSTAFRRSSRLSRIGAWAPPAWRAERARESEKSAGTSHSPFRMQLLAGQILILSWFEICLNPASSS